MSNWQASRPLVLLFDLDGTLVDSAPDLAATANHMRAAEGLHQLPYEALRPGASSGARGMLRAAFGLAPGDDGYEVRRQRFLDLYEVRMFDQTRLFHAVPALVDELSRRGLAWGIVTNKAARLAEPIARALGLLPAARVLVCGDTTPHIKPHPAPLLEAARRLGVDPATCVYVGDDHRDMQAGRAAGMAVLAAAWGYLGHGADVHAWSADAVLASPLDLLHWLDQP